MERNAYGLDANAPVASVNDLHELADQLHELWSAKFGEMSAESDPMRYATLQGKVEGVEDSLRVVNEFISRMHRRMPLE